jgi:hypothetical protein
VHLKNLKYQDPANLSIATIMRDIKSITTNNIFARKLISWSSYPFFDLGFFELILDLVSFPVYNTRPRTYPGDARTVFYHIVFSRVNGSLFYYKELS